MFMFGMRCVRCNHEIIAPHKAELLDNNVIRHLGTAPAARRTSSPFPRFPPNARSVKDAMRSVDIFPPLNGT